MAPPRLPAGGEDPITATRTGYGRADQRRGKCRAKSGQGVWHMPHPPVSAGGSTANLVAARPPARLPDLSPQASAAGAEPPGRSPTNQHFRAGGERTWKMQSRARALANLPALLISRACPMNESLRGGQMSEFIVCLITSYVNHRWKKIEKYAETARSCSGIPDLCRQVLRQGNPCRVPRATFDGGDNIARERKGKRAAAGVSTGARSISWRFIGDSRMATWIGRLTGRQAESGRGRVGQRESQAQMSPSRQGAPTLCPSLRHSREASRHGRNCAWRHCRPGPTFHCDGLFGRVI